MSSQDSPNLAATDPTEYATIWGLAQANLRQVLALCYRSGDVRDDARRFFASDEFAETVELLGRLGKPARAGYRVLDVGCGNGIACYAFARAGYDVTGVDISEGELAGLKGARSVIGVDDARFRVLNHNMESISLTDHLFDVVYMRQALHHCSDPVKSVREISRLLAPGGIFCAIREHVVRDNRQLQRFLDTHPFQHITRDEHAFTLSTYRAAFRLARLTRRAELFPFDSQINFYPGSFVDLLDYLSKMVHIDLKRHRKTSRFLLRLLAYKHQLAKDQLYSFFYEKQIS